MLELIKMVFSTVGSKNIENKKQKNSLAYSDVIYLTRGVTLNRHGLGTVAP